MKRIFFVFYIVLFMNDLSAQVAINHMNNYYPPSPEAASLIDKNASYSVDHYTGKLNYSIPMLKANISGLNFDIGLRYTTSGFKVQEVTGSVGLGWNLMAGGVITRYVEGLPDDDANGYCGANNIGEKTNAAYNEEYFKKITSGDWDSQPDKFFISFMGVSGVFRLDKDGNGIIHSSENGLKIVYSPFNRINGRMNSGAEEWIISDQKGNRYFFGSENIETTVSKANKKGGGTTDKTFISSWFIKKVVTSNNKTINFEYSKGASIAYDYYVNVRSFLSTQGACSVSGNPETFGNENVNIVISEPLYLSRIYSNDSEAAILLSYNGLRLDLHNGKFLTDIVLQYKNVVKKKLSLNYSYFNSNDGSGAKRLKLIGVNDVALSGEVAHLYQFTYDESNVLPARSSIKTDYWGYHNNNQGTSNIEGYGNSNKSPSFSHTKSCVLTKVLNSLGGSVNFEYEPNMYREGNSNVVGAGIRIKRKFEKIKNTTGGEETLEEEYSYLDNSSQLSSGQTYLKPQSSELLYYLLTLGVVNGNPWPCVIGFANKYSEPLISLFDLNEVSIGYSRVRVKNKKGSIVFTFTNFSDNADELELGKYGTLSEVVAINVQPQFPSTSYGFMRGKIKSQEVLGIDEQKVQSTTYQYVSFQSSANIVGVKAYPYITSGNNVSYHYGKYYYFNADYSLTSKTTTQFKSGVSTNVVTEVITYNAVYRNLISKKETSDLSGRTLKETLTYPFESWNDPVLIVMTQKNKISEPVTMEKYVNNNLVTQDVWKYSLWHSDPNKITAPIRVSQKIGPSALETKLNYSAYDSYGNVQELNKQNGITQSYVWGYSGLYIIAKVDGANYNDVISHIDPQIINGTANYSDQDVRDELDKIRVGLPLAQVTTYTYNPFIGLTSQTGPNGMTTYYDYDWFGRLQTIKNNDGVINKLYKYHTISMEPNWISTGINTDCEKVEDQEYNSQLVNTGNISIEQKDMNPNSLTYNQTRMVLDPNNTSLTCPASYYFTYNTDNYLSTVVIKAKKSYEDGTTKTMRFRVRHDSLQWGSQVFEQYVDIPFHTANQVTAEEWLYVNAASFIEVELIDIF